MQQPRYIYKKNYSKNKLFKAWVEPKMLKDMLWKIKAGILNI